MFRHPHVDLARSTSKDPRPYTVLGPATKPIFPKKFVTRNVWAQLMQKEKSILKIVDRLEGCCRLIETFFATLKNPDIDISEKERYLEETYGKESFKHLFNSYKISLDFQSLLISSNFESFKKTAIEGFVDHIEKDARITTDKIRKNLLPDINADNDYDKLYLILRGEYLGCYSESVTFPNGIRNPHKELYKKVFKDAYEAIRPYCKELDKLYSRCLKDNKTLSLPKIDKDLDNSLEELLKTFQRIKLKKLAPVFEEYFKKAFLKLKPNDNKAKRSDCQSQYFDTFSQKINALMETIELKKIFDHFIEKLNNCTLNPDEDAQKIFLGLLTNMIDSMIAHSEKFQGDPLRKYKSRLPSEKEWDDFFKKIKDLNPIPQFKKKALKEINDQKIMDLADLIAPMGSLTISSESEEEEEVEKEDEVVVTAVENNDDTSIASSSSSLVVTTPQKDANLVTSRSLTDKKADKSYRDTMTRVLSHGKNSAVYEAMFNTAEKSTVTWEGLFACIKSFGGSINNGGKTTGSGSTVMLPSMLTAADELAPSLKKTVNFHSPHGKRSDSDIVNRGILEEFKAGFVAVGLTPDKFGIEMVDEEKKTKPRSG